MASTSSHLPVCVYCGTARPADESVCPNCGKPWIDVSIAATNQAPPSQPTVPPPTDEGPTTELPVAAAAAGSIAASSAPSPPPAAGAGEPAPPPPVTIDDTGEFGFDDWTMPPDRPKSRARWLIPIILLVAVIVVWVLVFLDGGSTPDTTTTVAETTTTIAETTTTVAETTTTVAETTTTVAETTTTVAAFPPPSAWPPVGDPIDAAELTLKADGIGPLVFEAPLSEAAGRLTATLGEAEGAGTDGLCPTGEGYWLQWGELKVIASGFDDDATFVSYRYEDVGSDTELGLTTLSGLALGDTVADLQRIYGQFTIAFEVIEGKDHFRLVDGADLLLWGPVSATDADGIIEGIYSPSPCDA